MNCPHCLSTTTKEHSKKTALGYRTFRGCVAKKEANLVEYVEKSERGVVLQEVS